MDAKTPGSIVKVDPRPYRKIAQEHWGLSDEQMKGMHVHHRIPVSEGGTNDPSNLYVCSPSFHAWAWHGCSFVEMAREAGRKGSKAQPVSTKIANGLTHGSNNLQEVRNRPGHQRKASLRAAEVRRQRMSIDEEFREKYEQLGHALSKYHRERRGQSEEYEEWFVETRRKAAKASAKKTRKRVSMINIDSGEEINFPSLTSASQHTGVSVASISQALRGKASRAGRWIPMYSGVKT
jgi:hypothetical protein